MSDRRRTSLSGHQSAKNGSVEWFTPRSILDPLGPFDLDPCTSERRPWPTARYFHYALPLDGLKLEWVGRVWCNPPFGREASNWLAKMARHRNGIALVHARTETEMFTRWVWPYADAVCFVAGRIHFHYPDGTRAKANSGAPVALIAYGNQNARVLEKAGLGQVVRW